MWTAAAFLLAASASAAPPFAIDGSLEDWASVPVAADDPGDDASGSLDVVSVRAAGAGSTLWLSLELASPANLQAGDEREGTLRIRAASAGRAVTIDLRNRDAFDDRGRELTWNDIAFVALPTYAASAFEMRIDLAPIGVREGDEVEITLSESDSLDAPIRLRMGAPADQRADRSPNRHACASLRVASLNTERHGLTDPARAGAFRRLLDLADADVYAFQEEWDTPQETLRRRLDEFDPRGDGRPWVVHKIGGCAIAARDKLIPAWSFDSSYAAAIVDPGPTPQDGMAVLIVSVHLKCCGYAGSEEDQRRVRQALEIRRTIAELRAGRMGDELLPYRDAPAVILGDWNLVGSRRPLDELTGPTLKGFERLDVRHVGSPHAWTWRDRDGKGFPPGVLDHIVFQSSDLLGLSGIALSEDPAAPFDPASLGLRAGDLEASDHALLIADFAFFAPADLNGDGCVNAEDLREFERRPRDLDGDGATDGADLALLERWIRLAGPR